jgi:hypothetical protein
VTDEITEPGVPLPSTRRQTDALALALFDVMRHRSEVDRKHVLEALRFGSSGPDAAVRVRAVEALRLAQAELGEFPSYRRYEAWRLSQACPHEWPSGSSIGRVWGRWSLMPDALGERVAPRPATVGMRDIGAVLTRDELLDAIRTCAQEVASRPLTLTDYQQWAHATKQREDHTRIPLSGDPFIREFGAFAHAAREAGLRGVEATGLTVGTYSDQQICEALRRCSHELQDAAPTSNAYRQWRRPLMTSLRERGDGSPLPSDTAALARYQTWAHALHAAGLITDEQIAQVRWRGSRQPLNERRVAAALIAAVRELGPQITPSQYDRWRARQPRPFGQPHAPNQQTLTRRYVRWPNLIATVVSVLSAEDPVADLERILEAIQS